MTTAAEEPIDPELRAAIGRLARVPQLLVACDYDGTLALAERGLGNHPQAYSHLGLIRCALLLDAPA